jgi:hypothetical protein
LKESTKRPRVQTVTIAMQPEVDDDEDDDEMALHLFARYGDAETPSETRPLSRKVVIGARGLVRIREKVSSAWKG